MAVDVTPATARRAAVYRLAHKLMALADQTVGTPPVDSTPQVKDSSADTTPDTTTTHDPTDHNTTAEKDDTNLCGPSSNAAGMHKEAETAFEKRTNESCNLERAYNEDVSSSVGGCQSHSQGVNEAGCSDGGIMDTGRFPTTDADSTEIDEREEARLKSIMENLLQKFLHEINADKI